MSPRPTSSVSSPRKRLISGERQAAALRRLVDNRARRGGERDDCLQATGEAGTAGAYRELAESQVRVKRPAATPGLRQTGCVLTAFGVVVLTFMMLMYALERRGEGFVLAFAVGCALASVYGFLAGTWPFGVVELIWSGIALRRYVRLRGERRLGRP